jgi:hypothetical protein
MSEKLNLETSVMGEKLNFEVLSMRVKSPDGILLDVKHTPNPSMPLDVDNALYQLLLESISVMGDIYRNSTDLTSKAKAWQFMAKAIKTSVPNTENS